jgi:hypothetical protein
LNLKTQHDQHHPNGQRRQIRHALKAGHGRNTSASQPVKKKKPIFQYIQEVKTWPNLEIEPRPVYHPLSKPLLTLFAPALFLSHGIFKKFVGRQMERGEVGTGSKLWLAISLQYLVSIFQGTVWRPRGGEEPRCAIHCHRERLSKPTFRATIFTSSNIINTVKYGRICYAILLCILIYPNNKSQ